MSPEWYCAYEPLREDKSLSKMAPPVREDAPKKSMARPGSRRGLKSKAMGMRSGKRAGSQRMKGEGEDVRGRMWPSL